MDESTAELDFHQRGADERSLEGETPTTGRPPLGDVLSSGVELSSFTPSRAVLIDTVTNDVFGFHVSSADRIHHDVLIKSNDIIGTGDDVVQRSSNGLANDEFRIFSRREKRGY
ncbi:unnamed protein product [Heligmosomoides polygyrus]|uniref:PDZ domain-containing protein n=1 Tax=Heligmosomoides polygyrus TaxID=6339 RepID=A0A183GH80_HELPZ|nr:unnamed protein product [Heligmosomoides polygyrus]